MSNAFALLGAAGKKEALNDNGYRTKNNGFKAPEGARQVVLHVLAMTSRGGMHELAAGGPLDVKRQKRLDWNDIKQEWFQPGSRS